ncbi:MAG: phage holin family protein [Bacilli bacterium]|nr:phage holin family protein [Bacilli bacterium]
MKLIIKEKNEKRLNKLLDSILYISGYALVLFIVDLIFNSFDIDNNLYFFLTVLIIYILNKTIKPLIVRLTLPLTALTFGLFYPFINFFILEIVDVLLGNHLQIYGFWSTLLISIVISVMNFFVQNLIIDPIIRRCDNV